MRCEHRRLESHGFGSHVTGPKNKGTIGTRTSNVYSKCGYVMFIFRIQKWFPKKADNPGESMRKSHPPKYCSGCSSGSCNSQQILCFWGAICPNLWERVVEMGKAMTRPLKSPPKKGPLHFWTCGMGKKKKYSASKMVWSTFAPVCHRFFAKAGLYRWILGLSYGMVYFITTFKQVLEQNRVNQSYPVENSHIDPENHQPFSGNSSSNPYLPGSFWGICWEGKP